MRPGKNAFRADWILPVSGPPIRDGLVVVNEGRIASVDSFEDSRVSCPITELDSTILIPGLINAHTHFEFSDLNEPLGSPGIEFTQWIRLIVASRRQIAEHKDVPAIKRKAIESGIEQSLAAGVVGIGEIATVPVCPDVYSGCGLSGVVFQEELGRDSSIVTSKLQQMKSDVADLSQISMAAGLSPHAPYSVHPVLFNGMLDVAKKNGLPVAIHLAESKAELHLMRDRDGPFVSLLKDLGAWYPETYPKTESPLDYLKPLAEVARSLVIHGNYLDANELDFVASKKDRMSIVFCPRTHAFFAHPKYPLHEMLDREINVAIGTDSRASNPDLSMFDELKHVASSFPDLEPAKILAMGTIGGARALGIEEFFGSLEQGKSALMNAVTVKDSIEDPWQHLFDAKTICRPLSITA